MSAIRNAIRNVIGADMYRPDSLPIYRGGGAPPAAASYKLNDDGTNAALFGQSWLETIAPARLRATYTTTGSSDSLVALPASLTSAPGLVTLVEGVPVVCGFVVNALEGNLSPINFGLYNFGGSGSVLINAEVTKTDGVTTGIIKAQSGTYPPSVTQFGVSYLGELVGAKIAIQATLASGSMTAKIWVNGALLGTSTGIATDGGVIALMQILDGATSDPGGVIDISCVPTVAAGLNSSYGDFSVGALDMVGHSLFTPAGVTGISDYWMNDDITRLWTTSALSTNVSAAGDPVGGWRGQLDVRTLTQAAAGTRLQYELDGILIDSTAAFKNINQTVSIGANDPFFLWIRQSCSSTNAADFGLSVSTGTVRSGIAGAFGNDYRVRVKFDGTTGNYDTDTDETGDRFIAVWYDGTNGYGMNDAGVVGSVVKGANASTITRLWVNALLASASVTKVKNMGFGTSAVTPAVAEQVRQWSKSRP